MDTDEYLITTKLAVDLLIHTEGGIYGNQKSTYDNCSGTGGRKQKICMGHTLDQKLQVGTHGGTNKNATLVPSRDGTTLNPTHYNCRNPDHLAYIYTGTCSL